MYRKFCNKYVIDKSQTKFYNKFIIIIINLKQPSGVEIKDVSKGEKKYE